MFSIRWKFSVILILLNIFTISIIIANSSDCRLDHLPAIALLREGLGGKEKLLSIMLNVLPLYCSQLNSTVGICVPLQVDSGHNVGQLWLLVG